MTKTLMVCQQGLDGRFHGEIALLPGVISHESNGRRMLARFWH
jgi:hypothetical protein